MPASQFGQKLRTLREAKGLTLEKLAALAGTSKASIRALEQKPLVDKWKPDKMAKIAEVLGVSEEFLRAESPEFLSGDDAVFLNRYRNASPEVRRKLSAILAVLEGK